MNHVNLLNNHNLFETDDPEFARDTLGRVARTTSFDISNGEKFFFRANFVGMNQLTLASYYDHGGTKVGFAAEDVVRQLICIRGSYEFRFDNKSTQSNPVGWSTLVPQNTKYSLAALPSSALISLRIDQSAVRRKIEAMIADCIFGEVRFTANPDATTPALESLKRAILYVASELSMDDAPSHSLAMREMEELLVLKFILAHTHSFSHLLDLKRSAAPSPWQLRRVEEYIEANLSKPTRIEDLAAVAGVSGRTLLRHFRNCRGLTPKEFVKQLRLQSAKKLLEKPSKRTTIGSVALRCGYQSPGRFSSDYRKAFAELPSETLGRSLRRSL